MDSHFEHALRSDGDRYFRVNYSGIGTIADPVFEQMQMLHGVCPLTSILEVGCTNGFRLEKARAAFGSSCTGLDASSDAVDEGLTRFPELRLEKGVAPASLDKFQGESFDLIVLGHFLYLLPRTEIFALAAKVDSLLASGGHLIVSDFFFPGHVSVGYAHTPDLQVFKQDPSSPWCWSPTYALVGRSVYPVSAYLTEGAHPQDWQTVDVVRKLSIDQAYADQPPRRTEPDTPA